MGRVDFVAVSVVIVLEIFWGITRRKKPQGFCFIRYVTISFDEF